MTFCMDPFRGRLKLGIVSHCCRDWHGLTTLNIRILLSMVTRLEPSLPERSSKVIASEVRHKLPLYLANRSLIHTRCTTVTSQGPEMVSLNSGLMGFDGGFTIRWLGNSIRSSVAGSPLNRELS